MQARRNCTSVLLGGSLDNLLAKPLGDSLGAYLHDSLTVSLADSLGDTSGNPLFESRPSRRASLCPVPASEDVASETTHPEDSQQDDEQQVATPVTWRR